jgi:energy-coupling factor transporter transmembrane protein EcfT
MAGVSSTTQITAGNQFFAKSLLHSWKFILVLVLFALLVVVDAGVLIRYWSRLSSPLASWLFLMVYVGAFGPLVRAWLRHGWINEFYQAGRFEDPIPDSPFDVLLQVAETGLMDSLFYTFTTMWRT